ncbi:MAG: TatD family hydrolase [Candidatus Woesearchaeota archaeon]|nr:MAG: TatD family hydrolase [Candidatus Woesearchaeota archaeon]
MLVDVHAHIFKNYFEDIDSVVKRAKEKNIVCVINNGLDKKTNREVLELSKKYKILEVALGIYPTEAFKMSKEEIEEELSFIEEQKNNIKAIGECGLDLHWDKNEDNFNKQKKVFTQLIELAEKIKKPVIVHSRKAEKEVIEILSSFKAKINMHCFGGNLKLVRKAVDLGFSFSMPVSIIRSTHFQAIANEVPISNLLTETDSPYLNPEVEKNEPAYIYKVIGKIAEIKGIDVKAVDKAIYKNFSKMFV